MGARGQARGFVTGLSGTALDLARLGAEQQKEIVLREDLGKYGYWDENGNFVEVDDYRLD